MSDGLKEDEIFWDKIRDEFDLLALEDAGDSDPLNATALDESLEDALLVLRRRVLFELFTKSQPKKEQRLYVGDVEALKKSNIDFSKPTKIVTHGWINSAKDDAVAMVRDAYMEQGDYNVIGIDWGSIAFRPYGWASRRVPVVGKYCASFIDFLQSQGLDPSMLTVVGHSLGAHVAGLAARFAQSQVEHVVALDPALPNFVLAGPGERVSRGDANYVEVMHTDAGFYGYVEPIGDIDFYPNGGSQQPGCVSNVCSHLRAFKYFAESLNSKAGFVAYKCESYSKFQDGVCSSNPKAYMGGIKPNYNATGTYYLNSNSRSPYAMGELALSSSNIFPNIRNNLLNYQFMRFPNYNLDSNLNMKAYALLGLLLICCVDVLVKDLASLVDQEDENLDPNDELVTNPVNAKAPNESLEHTQRDLDNRVFFFLYTKDNPIEGQRLYVDDDDALQKSNFNFSKPTKFVTHGWINTVKDGAVALVRDAYLQHGDYNVVGIDWGAISFTPYEWASSRVLMVSKYCSTFINFLQRKGLDLSDVTIVGHSLGGQIAGLTARYVEGHIDLVIALDPALPNFQLAGPGSRVARGDAGYVQVIHTNAGVFGYAEAIGDIDFYPNGGGLQAGCKTETCSHLRAFKYFAESINSPEFIAVECSSYSKFRSGECKSNRKISLGGVRPDDTVKGKFYLRTNGIPRFAQGDI
ncbi:uncharacterized protein LOC144470691 [Augochlora pura]